MKSDMLTKGVGTYLYLAPEQRDSNKYDAKVDMYSLGIILFELYYAFKTDHQKINCLE
jgi:eukaryotic translation initiation factor 2-alpha kinase 4